MYYSLYGGISGLLVSLFFIGGLVALSGLSVLTDHKLHQVAVLVAHSAQTRVKELQR